MADSLFEPRIAHVVLSYAVIAIFTLYFLKGIHELHGITESIADSSPDEAAPAFIL